ncbi:MAG: hypothetical protein WB683_02470 [Candidatus Sulfotelmatobacter sp.]
MAAVLGCNSNVTQLQRLAWKVNSTFRRDMRRILAPLTLNRSYADDPFIFPGQRDRA